MPRNDDGVPIDDPTIPGGPSKRYGVVCDGDRVGSGYDTATEAEEAWKEHRDKILSVLRKIDKRVRGQYEFFDARKQITAQELMRAAKAEKKT